MRCYTYPVLDLATHQCFLVGEEDAHGFVRIFLFRLLFIVLVMFCGKQEKTIILMSRMEDWNGV